MATERGLRRQLHWERRMWVRDEHPLFLVLTRLAEPATPLLTLAFRSKASSLCDKQGSSLPWIKGNSRPAGY